jgi:hypothetical protein
MDSRCFVLEPVKKQSVKDCEAFGEIVYLFEFGEERPSIFSYEYQKELERKLKELKFNPEYDFFVLTGFQVTLSIAVCVLSKMFESFDVLAFYTPAYSYSAITIGKESKCLNQ